jgi:hypothetical protein
VADGDHPVVGVVQFVVELDGGRQREVGGQLGEDLVGAVGRGLGDGLDRAVGVRGDGAAALRINIVETAGGEGQGARARGGPVETQIHLAPFAGGVGGGRGGIVGQVHVGPQAVTEAEGSGDVESGLEHGLIVVLQAVVDVGGQDVRIDRTLRRPGGRGRGNRREKQQGHRLFHADNSPWMMEWIGPDE